MTQQNYKNPNIEADYKCTVTDTVPTRLLDGTTIEVIRPARLEDPPEHGLFDFDGTLSLFREGWMDVMILMMV